MIFAPVIFTPEAREQISALYRWIAAEASPAIVLRYTEAVIAQYEALSSFPGRGTLRDDILPGLRITSCRKRTVIAFAIETDRVAIIGVFHGGQNYQATLEPDDEGRCSVRVASGWGFRHPTADRHH